VVLSARETVLEFAPQPTVTLAVGPLQEADRCRLLLRENDGLFVALNRRYVRVVYHDLILDCRLIRPFRSYGGAVVFQDLYDSLKLFEVIVKCLVLSLPTTVVRAPRVVQGYKNVSRSFKTVRNALDLLEQPNAVAIVVFFSSSSKDSILDCIVGLHCPHTMA